MRHRVRIRPWRLLAAVLTLVLAGSLLSACGSGSSGDVVINLYSGPQQNLQAIVDRCNELNDGKFRIKINLLPRGADGQREQLVRRLAAKDTGLDIMGLDITWTAELAEAGWIKEWTGENKRQATENTLEKPLEVATYEGKLYAAPYNSNVQLLWYRSDLVPNPPTTWDGLIAESERLADEGKPHYAEVTGAQYEGLVVWFNALVTSAGGEVVDSTGKKVVLDEHALKALRVMKKFATSKAADPSLSTTQEQEANLAMQGNRAAFQLNWPFVYAAMRDANPDMLKNFKWTQYPGIDGPGRSPLGGAEYAVGSYTKHADEAFDAALCLRDPESQKTAAVKDGLPPTISTVYDEPEMTQAYPMKDAIRTALQTAGSRPETPFYQNLSTTTSTILSPPRSIKPESTLDRLKDELSDALESKGVLP